MAERTETILLREMMRDGSYTKRMLDILKPEHFQDHHERAICTAIQGYVRSFGHPPTAEEAKIDADRLAGSLLCEEDRLPVAEYIDAIATEKTPSPSQEWLRKKTETFIREKSKHNALLGIIEAEETGKPTDSLIRAFQAADSFTLDESPCLSLDWRPLLEHLQSADEAFPFDVEILNEKTCGGPTRKTLSTIQAPMNTGKSLFMCHQAATYLRHGRNVIYITLEMGALKIQKRIYSNLLDTNINILDEWTTEEQWQKGTASLHNLGDLRIREYPGRSAHAGHFQRCIDTLKTREGFVPDVIIVDYMGETLSRSMKFGAQVGSYHYFGAVASELRGLGIENNAVVWTACQTNRDGYEGAPDLKNTADSNQINNIGDLILGMNRPKEDGPYIFRVLKNRDRQLHKEPFDVGVDTARMKLCDVDQQVYQAATEKRNKLIAVRRSTKPAFA